MLKCFLHHSQHDTNLDSHTSRFQIQETHYANDKMQFKVLYTVAIALLGANMAAGIATNECEQDGHLRQGSIAELTPSPDAACNCPNNCNYSEGNSCKYKAGVSCDGDTVSGRK